MPHSEISGSKSARLSPELIAACHVLHRLSTPRHPPDALRSLQHITPPQPQSHPTTSCDLAGTPACGLHSSPQRQDPTLHLKRAAYPCCLNMPTRCFPRPEDQKTAIDGSMPAFTSSPFTMSSKRSHIPATAGTVRLPACPLFAGLWPAGRGPREVADFVGCHGGPGPIRTADLTLIRGAL